MGRRWASYWLVIATCLFILPLTASAVMVLPVNLEYMASQADRIFRGKVVAVEDRKDEAGRWAQFITFDVLETFKGDLDSSLTIKQVSAAPSPDNSGHVVTRSLLPGVPQYKVGEEVLVFLSPDSEIGFTTSIGLLQGTFWVSTDAANLKKLRNGVNNAGLLKGMSAQPSYSAKGLSAGNFLAIQSKPDDLNLDQMRTLLQGLLTESE